MSVGPSTVPERRSRSRRRVGKPHGSSLSLTSLCFASSQPRTFCVPCATMPADAAHEGITQLLRAEAEASEVVKTAKDGAPPPLAEPAPPADPCAHPTPLLQIRSEGGAAEGRRQGGAGGDRDVQDEAGGALRHLQGREEQGQRRPLGEGQQGDRRRARRDQDAGTGAARAPPRQPTRAPSRPHPRCGR